MEYSIWNVLLVAIIIFVIYHIGFIRGWRLREITAQKYIDDMLAKKKTAEPPIMVKVSKVGNVFHIHKDDTFIVTVDSVKDANEKLQKLFTNKTVLIKEQNAKEEGFV